MDFSFFHRIWGDYFGTDEAPVEGKKVYEKNIGHRMGYKEHIGYMI